MIEDLKKIIEANNNINDDLLIKKDIDEYLLKLNKFATILTYYSKSKLIGFIAYYSNEILNRNAYLTLVIIDKDFRGEGIAKLLLESSISDIINRGFIHYKLEVLKTNIIAIKFYKKYGFSIEEDRGDLWLMNLNLI